MLVTTKRMPRFTVDNSKLYKTYKFPVGTSWITLKDNDVYLKSKKNIQEIHDDIQKIGVMKCANNDITLDFHSSDMYCCQSDACCSRAFLLMRLKNIQSQQKACAIKDKFLTNIEKEGQLLYLQDIQNTYQQLMKYRVVLNEFCDDADQHKREEIYTMIRSINLCLFDQARVIIEDSFEIWKKNNFKMTSEIEHIRGIRDSMNELYESERLFGDWIVDWKALYKHSLADYDIMTYKINRIDEEYRQYCSNQKVRE